MHVKVIKLKWEQQFDSWNAANYASGIFNIFICTEVRSWNGSFWDTKLPMLHLWDSIFYAVIAFIPWTVTVWKQAQECRRIVYKYVLYIYFLFKICNLFIFPGRPSNSVWNVGSGSQPCHPQSQTICVLQAKCALQYRCFLQGAQMIFFMESRSQVGVSWCFFAWELFQQNWISVFCDSAWIVLWTPSVPMPA